jgi:hypothetical protein
MGGVQSRHSPEGTRRDFRPQKSFSRAGQLARYEVPVCIVGEAIFQASRWLLFFPPLIKLEHTVLIKVKYL